MAARKTTKEPVKPEHTCKDCRYSYDWHNKGADGNLILCRCPHHQWCKFLYSDHCDHFQRR